MRVLGIPRVLAALAALTFLSGWHAAQTFWTGAVSNSWDNPFNWSTALVPGPGDSVVIQPAANQPSSFIFDPSAGSLSILNGAELTLSAGFDLTVGGNLWILGDLTVSSPSSEIVVGANWTNDGDFDAGGATVELAGNGLLNGGSVTVFEDLTLASGTRTVSSDLRVDGDFTVEAGATLDLGPGTTATVLGNWTSSATGASTVGAGTVEFQGVGLLTSGLNGLPNTIISAGVRSVSAATLSGDLTLTGGTLELLDNATLAVGGDALLSAGSLSFQSLFPGSEVLDIEGDASIAASLAAESADSVIRCAGDWSSEAAFAPAAATVELDGAGLRSLSGGAPSFHNLVVISGTVDVLSATTVTGDLAVATGATLSSNAGLSAQNVVLGVTALWDLSGQTHTVSGDWTSVGGSAVGGTVTFAGDGQVSTGAGSIDSVAVAGGTRTVQSLTVDQDLTLSGGALHVTEGSVVQVAGNAGLLGGALVFEDTGPAVEALDVAGGIQTNGTLLGDFGPSAEIRCGGNWTAVSSLAFLPGSVEAGTVVLGGPAAALMTGAPSLVHLRIAGGTKTLDAGASLSGGLEILSGATLITTGPLQAAGSVVLGDGSASWDLGGQTHPIGGDWTSSGASATGGTVQLTGSGVSLSTGGGTLAHLLVGGSASLSDADLGDLTVSGGQASVTAGSTVQVSGLAAFTGGTLGLGAGAVLDVDGGVDVTGAIAGSLAADATLRFAGSWTADASWTPAGGVTEYDGLGAAQLLGPEIHFFDLTLLAGSLTAAQSLTVADDLVLFGDLSTSAGVSVGGGVAVDAGASWNLGGQTAAVSGNWTSAGDPVLNGRLEFVGDGVLNTGGGTVPEVAISAGVRSVASSVIQGDLTLSGGTLRVTEDQIVLVGGNALFSGGQVSWSPTAAGGPEVLAIGGDAQVAAGIEFEGPNSIFTCEGNWTSSAPFAPTALTVILNGLSGTTVDGAPRFHHLTLQNAARTFQADTLVTGDLSLELGGGAVASAPVDVEGSVQLDAGTSFDLGGSVVSVAGDWISTGGSAVGLGQLRFDGDGLLSTGLSASVAGATVVAGTRDASTSTVTGSLGLTGGELRILDDQVLTVEGSAQLTGGVLTFAAGPGGLLETLDVNGDAELTCAAGAMGAGALILVSGDWSSNANWTPSAGSVLLDSGSVATVGGDQPTFHHLVILDGVKEVTAAVHVAGDLTIFDGQELRGWAPLEVLGNATLLPGATWRLGQQTHTVHGDWTSDGASLEQPGTIDFAGDGTLDTGSSSLPLMRVSAGTRAVRSSTVRVHLSTTGGTLLIEDGQTLTVEGNAELQGGTLAFEDSAAGTETLRVQGFAQVDAAAGTMSANSRFEVWGDWTSGTNWNPSEGVVILAPPSASTLNGSGPAFHSLVIDSGHVDALVAVEVGATLRVSAGAVLASQAAFDVGRVVLEDASAAWDVGPAEHRVAGDWTAVGGSATGSGGVEFHADGLVTTGGGSLPNVRVTSGERRMDGAQVSGDFELAGGLLEVQDDSTLSIAGDANFEGGVLALPGGTPAAPVPALDVEGDVVFAGTAAGDIGPEAELRCAGDWTSDADFQPAAGTVVLDGQGQTVSGTGLSLPRLRVDSGQTTVVSAADLGGLILLDGTALVATATLNVDGDVELGSDTPLDLGGGTHTVSGHWTSTGGSAADGIVVFDGDGSLDTGAGALDGAVIAAGTRSVLTSTVDGDLALLGGTLALLDDQVLTVAGNAELVAGTLDWSALASGPDEVLDVAGDVLCSATAGSTSAGSVLRCGGNWSSNGSFAMAAGRVELHGAGPAVLGGLAPGFDPTFAELRIQSGTRELFGDLTLQADPLTVETGAELAIGDHELVLAAGTANVAGRLAVGAGGELALGAGAVLLISAGGALEVVGTPVDPAAVTGWQGGGYFLSVDGELEAVNFRFEGMGAGGVVIQENATLVQLAAGTFADPSAAPGSVLLDIRRPVATQLAYLDFVGAGVGTYNVRVLGGAPITFVESHGDLAGAGFELDPLDLVDWVSSPTVVSDFQAVPSADLVSLAWTTSVETDTTEWVLRRAEASGGPFADLVSLAASGPGAYAFGDAAVTPAQGYLYQLVERKSFGLETVMAQASATPWGSGPAPTVLTVGPAGAYADVQSAVDAAGFAGAVVSIAPGTYPAFTVSGPLGQTLRILGDGTGSVVIDTALGPVTLQDLGPADTLEIGDLSIGDPSSGSEALWITNCQGAVVLDELVVRGGGPALAGIRAEASPRVAVQRCDVQGGPGLALASGSGAIVGRGALDTLDLTGLSSVRLAEVSPVSSVEIGSSLGVLPGVHADLAGPEFVSIGAPFSMTLDGETGGIFSLAFSGSMAWFDLGAPFEGVGLLNLLQAPVVQTGVLAGPALLGLAVPADGVLYGQSLPLQAVVVNPVTLKFRWSNVTSIVLGD